MIEQHWLDAIKQRFEYVGKVHPATSRIYRDRACGRLCNLVICPDTGDLVPRYFQEESQA